MNKPKWLKPVEPPVQDVLSLIATGGVAPASNVEVMKAEQPMPPVDLAMQKLANLSHERQAAVRKLAAQWLVLKRYGLAALTVEELEEVIKRLP